MRHPGPAWAPSGLNRAVARALDGLRRRFEPRRRAGAASDASIRVPLGYDDHDEACRGYRIGVVCHLFFVDLCTDIRAAVDRIPFPADVMITTDTPDKRALILDRFADWARGTVTVTVVENRGRDIAPKLTAFSPLYPGYDLLLFLHTKKSIGFAAGAAWRAALLQSLAGSEAIVRSIVEIFARQPQIGIVAPQHFGPVQRWIGWNGNYRACKALARRMGFRISRGRTLDFPSGSMFWARPRALRPLLDLKLQPGDFPAEAGQTNAALHHAIERLFFLACEDAGYGWVKVSGPDSCDQPGVAWRVSCPSELDAAVEGSEKGGSGPRRGTDRAPSRTIMSTIT